MRTARTPTTDSHGGAIGHSVVVDFSFAARPANNPRPRATADGDATPDARDVLQRGARLQLEVVVKQKVDGGLEVVFNDAARAEECLAQEGAPMLRRDEALVVKQKVDGGDDDRVAVRTVSFVI